MRSEKMIMKRSARWSIGPLLMVAAVALAACTPPGDAAPTPTDSPSARPVTISAPEKAKASDVTVKVTGTPGESLDVYAFDGGWNTKTPPDCTEIDEPERSVQVGAEGTSEVRVSVGPGIWWWVVASQSRGITSECGAVTTTVTYGNDMDFTFSGPDSPSDSLNAYQGTFEVGEPISFWVTATRGAPKDARGWPITVDWLGPFDSVPEASAGCQNDNAPVGASTEGIAPSDRQEHISSDDTKLEVTLPEPGVYAVMASTPATEWNDPISTPCDNTTPILVAE